MKVLVINCGSSSLKYQLLDMAGETLLAAGLVERIAEPMGKITHTNHTGSAAGKKNATEMVLPDHRAAMQATVDRLTDKETGVISGPEEIDAIGHRVVHGGEAFQKPALVTPEMIAAVEKMNPIAPLHNPANLMGIAVAEELFPAAPQVGIFDTAFHQTAPPSVYHYALPWSCYEELGVRRYGFHGTSHQYIAQETARRLCKPVSAVNLISAHLGSGASVCAIAGGKSVDYSMGMTPLGGLIMGTRGGNLDPGVILHIARSKNLSLDEVDAVLNKESGLRGICGQNDLRDIHDAIAKGDERAKLALEMFVYRCRQYIGAYLLELDPLDALVFTAGVGENDEIVRAGVCARMERFGLKLDAKRNLAPKEHGGLISTDDSSVKVMVIPTNEELQIARQTVEVVEAG